jgi:hypothetical protein
MQSNLKIKKSNSKIISPFIKGKKIFPIDFFWSNDKMHKRNSRKDKLKDKINSTFDHSEKSLLEGSFDQPALPISHLRMNGSLGKVNRKYVKLRNFSSKMSKAQLNLNEVSMAHHLKSLNILNKGKDPSKLSRNSSRINNACSEQIKSNYLTSSIGWMDKLRRPQIKSKIQNFVNDTDNKGFQFASTGNQSIKLDCFALEKLGQCNNSFLNNSELETRDNINNSKGKLEFIYKYEAYSSLKIPLKPGYRSIRREGSKLKQKKKLLPSKRIFQTMKEWVDKENINLNSSLSHQRSSSKKAKMNSSNISLRNSVNSLIKDIEKQPKRRDTVNKSFTNALVNNTIEYYDKTMIEEYTNSEIPEFTLGPKWFAIEPKQKPLSVNKLGFYKEFRTLESQLSPIKKSQKNLKIASLWNIRSKNAEVKEQMEKTSRKVEISLDEEFYDNKDLLSIDTEEKNDSTKKYIDLVDNFSKASQNFMNETPSFKVRDIEHKAADAFKFEDVLNQNDKLEISSSLNLDRHLKPNSQVSTNTHSAKNRWSSEVHTFRRSSVTRAESDNGESFGATSKRIKESMSKRRGIFRNSMKLDKNKSLKEINISWIMKQDPKRLKIKRKLFWVSKYIQVAGQKENKKDSNFQLVCSCRWFFHTAL